MANILEINGLDSPDLALFSRLTEAQLRNRLEPEKGVFIAESPKVITAALDAGYEPVARLMERRHIQGQAAGIIERCFDIPVYTADRAVLAGLTGYELTRGVLCAMRRPGLPPVEALCQNARRVAVLEGVVDSTNIGAIFRSAAALGVDAILLTPTCCDPLNRRAVRVSMGTVFKLPWTYIDGNWPEGGLHVLKDLGFTTAAMALSDTFTTTLQNLLSYDGVTNAIKLLPGLQKAVYTFLGKAVNADIAAIVNTRRVDINIYLTLS